MSDRSSGAAAAEAAASRARIEELAALFRSVGDESRLRILLVCLDQPVSVGRIAARLGLSLSLVSHHLRLLHAARLVTRTRRGREVLYAAADAHVREMLKGMLDHLAEEHH